jgi:hypothetical protein
VVVSLHAFCRASFSACDIVSAVDVNVAGVVAAGLPKERLVDALPAAWLDAPFVAAAPGYLADEYIR